MVLFKVPGDISEPRLVYDAPEPGMIAAPGVMPGATDMSAMYPVKP